MPVTSGHGNPDWVPDETLLALDLLYRHGKPIGKTHPDVVDLSNTLRGGPWHPKEGRKDNFRNADGVALKLQNLQSALDPARGLSSSKTDRTCVKRFPPSSKAELRIIAQAIQQGLASEVPSEAPPADEVFAEGWYVTVRHRYRDARLRSRLLKTLDDEDLCCAICDFAPPNIMREFRQSFFEAHHVVPLSTAETERSTRVTDMALLCAGCHRFIHKLIVHEGQWLGIVDAREYYRGSTLVGKEV